MEISMKSELKMFTSSKKSVMHTTCGNINEIKTKNVI